MCLGAGSNWPHEADWRTLMSFPTFSTVNPLFSARRKFSRLSLHWKHLYRVIRLTSLGSLSRCPLYDYQGSHLDYKTASPIHYSSIKSANSSCCKEIPSESSFSSPVLYDTRHTQNWNPLIVPATKSLKLKKTANFTAAEKGWFTVSISTIQCSAKTWSSCRNSCQESMHRPSIRVPTLL